MEREEYPGYRIWEVYLARAAARAGEKRFGGRRVDLRTDLIKTMQTPGVELLLIIFWICNR